MYLGLDLSLQSTGVCALVDSQHATTQAIRPVSITGAARLRYIAKALEEFIDIYGKASFELAAVEGYALGARGKTFHIGELGGVIRYKLDYWDIPFIVVGPGELKKFFTGNGRADKVQMGQVAHAQYDRDFLRKNWVGQKKNKPRPADWGQKDAHWNNDECDAFALANVAAFYDDAWDRVPTNEQLGIRESIRQDPMSILSVEAAARQEPA